MDILHAMKDALMKYETIDEQQIDDLMNRRPVREPSPAPENQGGTEGPDSGNTDGGSGGAAESEGPAGEKAGSSAGSEEKDTGKGGTDNKDSTEK